MSDLDSDREAILKLHKDWWEANHQLVIPLMEPVFPKGKDSYLMFNLNGHPYFGIEEKVALWEWYQKQLDIVMYPDVQIMRLTISGDMAYLCCEGIFPLRAIGEAGTGSATWELKDGDYDNFRLRATEVYQRDDGDGNAEWRMWHFHCSPMPPDDEERPALGGTSESRGLGCGPGISPFRVTSEGVRPS